jgi:hypothetical protein
MKRTPAGTDGGQTDAGAEARAARLKAALRANLARRKAQTRARQAVADDSGPADDTRSPADRG